jgi:hypothetical protein
MRNSICAELRRLTRLEARVQPTDEPEEFVDFVGPEKAVVRTASI